jgi:hypothetical protein
MLRHPPSRRAVSQTVPASPLSLAYLDPSGRGGGGDALPAR